MTKILLVGDIHVSDKPPAMCTDSYTDDIIEMLRWVADYAVQIGADAVVWAGDIFHHKAPMKNSHALVLKMIRVVQYYIERGLDLQIVPGNHDIVNDRLESIHAQQPLGVLYAAGAKELHGWHETLPLYGVPWQQDWTTNTSAALDRAFHSWRVDPWRFEKDTNALSRSDCLVVTHAPIYPPDLVAKGVPFDLVDTRALADAMGNEGCLYYGHIHEDHGIFFDGGVSFANVGAISRGSLHEYNLERSIKVALWSDGDYDGADGLDLGEPGGGKVTLLGVPGFFEIAVPHKPASEVFRLEQAMENRAAELDLSQFLARVGSAQVDMSSVASIVAHIRTADAPENVKARAIEFLEAADG